MRVPEIKIVPVGAVDQDVLDHLALTIGESFNSRCNCINRAIDVSDAYDPTRRQYNSTQILTMLLDLSRDDGNKILGVTGVDLFIPILTFVFGEAQLGGQVALVSVHRLHPEFYGLPEDQRLFHGRCEKEAKHELGHTCGLKHCRSYDCVMHVSNSVEQVDLKLSGFCPDCAALINNFGSHSFDFYMRFS